MAFDKEFVRVEWLALQRVVDLMREAMIDADYFVSKSRLLGDYGPCIDLAAAGRELYDEKGQFVKSEVLGAKDFGLAEDVGELVAAPGDLDKPNMPYFLARNYRFDVLKVGEKYSHVCAWIVFAKREENSDWEIVLESITDAHGVGDGRWLIYRRKD